MTEKQTTTAWTHRLRPRKTAPVKDSVQPALEPAELPRVKAEDIQPAPEPAELPRVKAEDIQPAPELTELPRVKADDIQPAPELAELPRVTEGGSIYPDIPESAALLPVDEGSIQPKPTEEQAEWSHFMEEESSQSDDSEESEPHTSELEEPLPNIDNEVDSKKPKQITVDENWAMPLDENSIRRDYTFLNGLWTLMTPRKLRDELLKFNPSHKVRYCRHNGNCVYASIIESGRLECRISELKSKSLKFMLENESQLTEMFKDLNLNATDWVDKTKEMLSARNGLGNLHTICIIALCCKRNIDYYDTQTKEFITAPGIYHCLQTEPLSGPDFYIIFRHHNCYMYDSNFKPKYRSQGHASPIIPVTPAERALYHLAASVSKFQNKYRLIQDIEYLLFECEIHVPTKPGESDSEFNKVTLSLTPGDNGSCEFNFRPLDPLVHLIQPEASLVKSEYRQDDTGHAYISITESINKKCVIRTADCTEVTVKFSMYEQKIALWLFQAIVTGHPYDQDTENEMTRPHDPA